MHLVTKKEFSRLAQVSTAAVSGAVRTKLQGALVGDQINIEHPDALKYIESGLVKQQRYAAGVQKTGVKSLKQTNENTPNIQAYLDMTLREIHEKHGTAPAFLEYLKAVKEIEKIQETRLKNGEREGTLVTRHLVKTAVLEPIDTAHTKLLTDGARSIARVLKNKYDGGADVVECEKWVSQRIAQFIKAAKAKSQKAIETGASRY